jgi:hypothetical protein
VTDTDDNYEDIDTHIYGRVGWVDPENPADWLPERLVEDERRHLEKVKAEEEAKAQEKEDHLDYLRLRGHKVRTPAEVTADVLDRAAKQSRAEDFKEYRRTGGAPQQRDPVDEKEARAAEKRREGWAALERLKEKRPPKKLTIRQRYEQYVSDKRAEGGKPVCYAWFVAGRR